MRIEGPLEKWNDERGFGFIAPTKGDAEVFAHVSAFPRDGQRPAIGETLTFEIETDKDGNRRAKNLLCPDRVVRLTSRRPAPRSRHKQPSLFGRLVPIAVVVALAAYAYGEYSRRAIPHAPAAVHRNDQPASSAFHCDGRTQCSQMTSCAETTFFLKNCPTVQMDGDNDGIPCERQWCGK
ncbi:MAG: Cold shock-like protein CspB [Candidatus Accumulibacter appositus]|uniref:Cold shock-like protein CspB n=1 Tax=Candidatus Accumulibacter appositus TaxID=1454003 RepID=A0A011QMS5_9PROT|nr:cold shock domain-containing protein [Accumulibacter sp.]EXI80174.1 MAG: Cold shock-like protein CspB [Candidatus Accumulibacter appositus]HRF03618.1 cold shock domain-containing protein [Accumulibacter sp.]